jgi:hypothetical protein
MSTRADTAQQSGPRSDSSIGRGSLASATWDGRAPDSSTAIPESIAMHAVTIAMLVILFVADTGPVATSVTPT